MLPCVESVRIFCHLSLLLLLSSVWWCFCSVCFGYCCCSIEAVIKLMAVLYRHFEVYRREGGIRSLEKVNGVAASSPVNE